jgi:hypothetical protein
MAIKSLDEPDFGSGDLPAKMSGGKIDRFSLRSFFEIILDPD